MNIYTYCSKYYLCFSGKLHKIKSQNSFKFSWKLKSLSFFVNGFMPWKIDVLENKK